MLVRPQIARLVITEKKPLEMSAVCTTCRRPFHAYVRSTKKEALVRLQRNFRIHSRYCHSAPAAAIA